LISKMREPGINGPFYAIPLRIELKNLPGALSWKITGPGAPSYRLLTRGLLAAKDFIIPAHDAPFDFSDVKHFPPDD